MNVVEFTKELSTQCVELWCDGDRLRYRAPKDVLTPTLLNKIKHHKADILKWLHGSASKAYPLSHGQRALWLLHQIAPESAAYHFEFALRIRSNLDVPALRRAYQALINRHQALRTTFTMQGSEPIQEVKEYQEVCFEETDASSWTWAELNKRVIETYQRPFDLERGPLLRVNLFTRSEQDYILLLTVHHIVYDGWSSWLCQDEWRVLYAAEIAGTQASLPPIERTYADYVRWQTQMLAESKGEKLWAYWQKQLAGELPILNLPTDRPRPPLQSYRGASHLFKLSVELTQQLKELTQTEGATLYMILVAAFQVLLHRYTGQEDILVGSPTAGRNQPEWARVVGYFINPVVLRANFVANPTFKTFLRQMRHTVLDALAHQDYPFPLLVERLQQKTDPSYSPLFQVLFVLHKPQQQSGEWLEGSVPSKTEKRLKVGDLDMKSFEIAQHDSQFDLTLEMIEVKASLFGVFKYNTDLFDASTISRMAGHFQHLLEGIVAHHEQRISDLPLLTEAEQQQLLVTWNNTQTEYPREKCIHQLFEAQVERTPDAIAIMFEDQHLSYAALNRRANQLAHHLQTLGVKPEVLVGICIERSIEMVIGLLGILKAGGAYLPLDPAYPAARLAFMLEDAGVPVLLTQSSLKEGLPETTAPVVCLDTERKTLSSLSTDNLDNGVAPFNLAYVIYTSGSTGKPKGVAIEHRSTVAFLTWSKTVFTPEQLAGVLASTSLSFDLSIFELFVPLTGGSKIILVENALNLPTLSNDIGVTLVNTVPSAINELVKMNGVPASVQVVNLAGEPLSHQLVQKIYQIDTIQQVFNLYGPSEYTTYSTFALIKKGEAPTIGNPITNTQIYILDTNDQPVPVGVPGELHIGGAGLARGYLNRPELTASKFIPNPFSDDPGAHLYKTGDLARYLPDGNIEFIGRLDNQIKIRGFRIELGEIEAVLAQHPAVQECVVIVHESESGDKRLVAYLVPKKEKVIENSELRLLLKDRLPDYMIPSAFMQLEVMPLTPNGKIDRRALQLSDINWKDSETTFVPPQTQEEELMAGIWSDVLSIERIGLFDNFFELGGHSLLATQIISRVRDTFSIELPLRHLFESPTIAGLNEHLKVARCDQSLPPITPLNQDEPRPLSFAQQRLWFLEQLEGSSATYNMPSAGHLKGQLNRAALEQSLQTLVQRHETLRTTFQTVEGQPLPVVSPVEHWSLSVVDLQHLNVEEQEHEIQRLVNEEVQRPFELSQGPLFRATLLQKGIESHVLLLNMHHIISDGWSIGVFNRELSTLYQAASKGQPSPLPPLPIQYADFAQWQRQWLTGDVLETQLNYWKQQLAGAPALLELPTDHPRPPIQRFQGKTASLQLSSELTEQLKNLSQQAGSTLFMTLLAAFATLLSRYSGQSDLVIGSPIANRTHRQIEPLIGFFLNTLALRIDLSGNPRFEELLRRIRQMALDAYAHQDIPFEKLVEELQPERSLSHSPLFQVMLVFQNTPTSAFELDGITVTPLKKDALTTKFDLNFHWAETPQGLRGILFYNTELFNQDTITWMLGHFQTLLENLVTAPSKRLSSLRLLTETERHHLSTRGNLVHPTTPFIEFEKREQSIPERFEQQLIKYPDHMAVKTKRYTWTYRDLNDKANQVAQAILAPAEEERVALLFKPDAPMLVGIMGVLKAGKTYVPLDPDLPRERLEYIVQDSQASAILTNDQNLSLAQALTSNTLRLINIDEIKLVASRDEIQPTLSADSIAYLLYTSGSTGQPKAVRQNHRNVLHFIRTYTNHLHITTNDKLTLLSSYSFDAAIMDIFGALLNGATLYPVNLKEESLSNLSSWLIQQEITLYHSTPTVYRHWLNTLTEEKFPKIRLVVLGGEPVYKDDVDKYRKHFSTNGIFINGLGPTESTVSLQYFINHQTEITHQAVPVGYPVEETEILLLNEAGEETDIYGEMAIKSPYIALGYWQKPEITQAVFLTDEDNQRFYRTGDMGRLRADGSLEFVGRLDNQVKLRGFRIELGEIEAVLSQHQAVQETVVMLREEPAGEKRLVAYWVPNQAPATETIELRRFLKERLPEYMIPSALVQIEAMPLTPTGKIDRHALPAPDQTRYDLEKSFVAPRTKVEERLASIWTEVLRREPIGIHDNFFELGGHSLLATQVIVRLNESLSVDIPLRSLFETPTVAGLAEIITQGLADTVAPDEMAELLAELEGLSEQEAQRLLANDRCN